MAIAWVETRPPSDIAQLMDALRWAVIGTGHMADGIASAMDAVDGAHVASVVSRNREGATAFAARHGNPEIVATLEDALASGAVDAVYVGSPNAFHAEHARMALEAGCHVLCDKPMTTNPAAARALAGLAAQNELTLSVNLQNRHQPAARKVREWIAGGRIGRPAIARAALGFGEEALEGWRANADLAVAAALYNLGVHVIDTVVYLLGGRVTSVDAISRPLGAALDRTDLLNLEFANGAIASVLTSQELAHDDVLLEVIGTSGSIRWLNWMAPYRSGTLTLKTPEGTTEERTACPDAYVRLVADFCAAVREGRPAQPSQEDAVATVEVVEAARRAARSGVRQRL